MFMEHRLLKLSVFKSCWMVHVPLQVPSIEFNVSKLPMTEDVSSTWATIISLASHNFKAERDNREMDKTPMASSTLTVESEGKFPGFLVVMATNDNQGEG